MLMILQMVRFYYKEEKNIPSFPNIAQPTGSVISLI